MLYQTVRLSACPLSDGPHWICCWVTDRTIASHYSSYKLKVEATDRRRTPGKYEKLLALGINYLYR